MIWILLFNSGCVNVFVFSDLGEKKDDFYLNWDVIVKLIVFLVIGCFFFDIMCFFLEEGGV